jgi:hypothetical protein
MLNLRALALGAASIVLVAACGGSAPTQTSAGSSAATSSSGQVAGAPSSAVLPSAAVSLPSSASQPSVPGITGSHADPALEAMLPAAINGTPLQRSSLTFAAMLGTSTDRVAIDAFLQSIGKSESDGTVGLAFDQTGAVPGGVTAFKVTGADPTALLGGILAVEQSDAGGAATVTKETVGGKAVTVVSTGDGVNDTTWVYGHGDVVFAVQAPDAAGAAAFLQLLP